MERPPGAPRGHTRLAPRLQVVGDVEPARGDLVEPVQAVALPGTGREPQRLASQRRIAVEEESLQADLASRATTMTCPRGCAKSRHLETAKPFLEATFLMKRNGYANVNSLRSVKRFASKMVK